jgi:hypothetical protein
VEVGWKGIPAPVVEGAFGEPEVADDCWVVCVAIFFVLLFVDGRMYEDLLWFCGEVVLVLGGVFFGLL